MKKHLLTSLSVLALSTAILSCGAHAQTVETFRQGLTARQIWETWFGTLQGDTKAGAIYWAGQRSKPLPGSCFKADGVSSGEATTGCLAAKAMLAPIDARRKAEPDFRAGFNSYEVPVASSLIVAPSATATHPEPTPVVKPAVAPVLVNAQAPVAVAVEPKAPVTSEFAVICPSLDDLLDVYRLASSDSDAALGFSHDRGCQYLSAGVHLQIVERGVAITRILFTSWTSQKIYFIASSSIKAD